MVICSDFVLGQGATEFLLRKKNWVLREGFSNHIDYFFIRNETSVSADKDLTVYLNKVFGKRTKHYPYPAEYSCGVG